MCAVLLPPGVSPMCAVLLPPGVSQIAGNKYIKIISLSRSSNGHRGSAGGKGQGRGVNNQPHLAQSIATPLLSLCLHGTLQLEICLELSLNSLARI
jgi:hypothetical protein